MRKGDSTQRPLTYELITQKAKCHNFKYVERLNLWGLNIGDVSIVSQLNNLKVISLTMNSITTLKPFGECKKIEEIYLRKNFIADLSEIYYLKDLPVLKNLWLSENPCCQQDNYRLKVIKYLPQLIKLDDIEVTNEERSRAQQLNWQIGPSANNYENANNFQNNQNNRPKADYGYAEPPAQHQESGGKRSSQKKNNKKNKWNSRRNIAKKPEAYGGGNKQYGNDVVPSKLRMISRLSDENGDGVKDEYKSGGKREDQLSSGKEIFDSFKVTKTLKPLVDGQNNLNKDQIVKGSRKLRAIELLLDDLNKEELKYILYNVILIQEGKQ